MGEGSRALLQVWITGTLAAFAVAFALGGLAPLVAGGVSIFGGVLLWTTTSPSRRAYRRYASLAACLLLVLAAVLATASGRM